MTYRFTTEDTAQNLSALQDSVNLIDALIEANDRSDEQRDTMDRNVRHIHIMCAMDHLKCCGTDLKPYTDAAARGSAWLAQN
jgi:hypothetical protein